MLQLRPTSFSFSATLSITFLLSFGCLPPQAEAQSKSPQVKPAPQSPSINQDLRVKRIIDSSVSDVKGMHFPKIAPAQNAKTEGCCQPYDTRNVNGVAGIDISTPAGYNKNKFVPPEGPKERVYSPPTSCWIISTYKRQVTDANVPYDASDDAQPANFHYVTSSEYQSVFEEMKNYVGSLNILDKYKVDFNLKLEEFVKNYGNYSNEIGTSHGQVRHTARVQGRGKFNGSSWYRAVINTTEICCPAEVRDTGALRTTLKAWVDQTVKKLPRRWSIESQPVEIGTKPRDN